MSKDPTCKPSQTDWAYIDALQDEDIDMTDIHQVTEEQLSRAVLRIEGQPVSKSDARITMLLRAANCRNEQGAIL